MTFSRIEAIILLSILIVVNLIVSICFLIRDAIPLLKWLWLHRHDSVNITVRDAGKFIFKCIGIIVISAAIAMISNAVLARTFL